MDDKGNLEQEEGKLEQGELEQYEKHYDENTALRLLKKLRKETREKSAWIAGPVGKIVWALGHLLSAYSNPALPAKYKVMYNDRRSNWIHYLSIRPYTRRNPCYRLDR